MLYAMIALTATVTTPVDRSPPAPAPVAAAPQVQGSGAQGKPTNYCVVRTITGSILQVKTCKTREAWLATGFDPLVRRN